MSSPPPVFFSFILLVALYILLCDNRSMNIQNQKKEARKEFGKLIRKFRTTILKESQVQFGKRFEATGNTVSRWETGLYDPPSIVLRMIIDIQQWQKCPNCQGRGFVVKTKVELH